MSLRRATAVSLRASCNRSTSQCQWSPQRTSGAWPRTCCSRTGPVNASLSWRGRTALLHKTLQRRSGEFLDTLFASKPFRGRPGTDFSSHRECGIHCHVSRCWMASTRGGSTSSKDRPARRKEPSSSRPSCDSLLIAPLEGVHTIRMRICENGLADRNCSMLMSAATPSHPAIRARARREMKVALAVLGDVGAPYLDAYQEHGIRMALGP